MRSPNWPCQLISGSSNRPATFAKGCIISRFPTRPDEFASPSGCAGLAESSSSRGVPIALAATTTTFAGSKCSPPSRSIQVAPVARPRASVSIRRTRAPVTSRAPSAIAFGQWVRSVDALAPSLQPDWQVLRWTHGRRPSYGDRVDRVELGPPVPAELGVRARDLQPGRPDRERRHRRVLGCRAGRPGRRAGRTRRTGGRSDRSTAAARSSRSASRRRCRRASGRGSRTAARAARRRRR